MRSTPILIAALFATTAIAADEVSAPIAAAPVAANTSTEAASNTSAKSSEAKSDSSTKALSGMSILGNQEAPKALVIVPWKSSQLGDEQGIAKALDDGRQPVDKDVFMRELAYYQIRTGEIPTGAK